MLHFIKKLNVKCVTDVQCCKKGAYGETEDTSILSRHFESVIENKRPSSVASLQFNSKKERKK